jgi:lipoprotein signal peptidase
MIYVALIDFAVFNVADMAVTVGCCLLVLDLLFFKGKKYMEMMDKKPQTGENS